ncbi:MAG: ATPase associated with various cellular activity 5 [Firmicutes bacterium]|nr:ATPase associated with various cellular activity 5 [Bacillota bacterium]
MTEITLDSFKETLDVLIDANPHARNKGDEFKDWNKENFDCDARISYIKEQRQITNRVSEQFRYFAPVVVFVCVPEVKRDTLIKYILERGYKQLENVAIIGAISSDGEKKYTFEKLIVFKQSSFNEWATPFFDSVEDANSLKEEFGLAADDDEDGEDQEIVADESVRIADGKNVLLYGVPGSGKSWTIEHEYCRPGTKVERLVFHPDYTNADFVGQILPVVDPVDKQVTYEFTSGPFTNILRDAYQNPETSYVLIIEELNRGNAPAIFGDIFQLLDRAFDQKTVDGVTYPKGTSEYCITNENIARKVYNKGNQMVRIPSNLSIIGTMNTSDQNVFTLDTAFQRRWRMRLIENNFDNVRPSLADAGILDTGVSWKRFCETINTIIIGNKAKMASAEDKRLGVYFVHESDFTFDQRALPSEGNSTVLVEYNSLLGTERVGSITVEQKSRLMEIREAVMNNRLFPEKVIKYLWDDAFKFNPEALFDLDMDNLEKVIRTFVYSTGQDRFKIFKQSVRDTLYTAQQQ